MGKYTRAAVRMGSAILLRKLFVPILVVMLALGGFMGLIAVIGGTPGGSSSSGSSTASCKSITASGSSSTVPTSDEATRQNQIEIAKQIDQGVQELGFSGQVSRLIIIAAMGETTLRNLGYGDESQGVTNQDGSATTSKGVLQQQDFWGSLEDRLNPSKAAQLFILGKNYGGGGLADVAGWDKMDISQAIHAVQANADPIYSTEFIF